MLVSNERTYIRGKQLYQVGHVLRQDISKCKVMSEVLSGSEYSTYKVYFEDVGGIPIGMNCDCEAFHTYAGICKHCVAAMLEYVASKEMGSIQLGGLDGAGIQKGIKRTTDRYLGQLIYNNKYKTNITQLTSTSTRQELIDIEPSLIVNGAGICAEFKIGTVQKYIIKDIYEFVANFENELSYSYGKKLSFVHRRDCLTEHAQFILDVLIEWTMEYEDNYEKFHYYAVEISYKVVKSIPINGYYLEKLILHSGCKSIMVKEDRYDKEEYTIDIDKKAIQFYIDQLEEGIEISADRFKICRGSQYYVAMDGKSIQCISKKYYKSISRVIDAIANNRWKPLFINNEDVSSFCANILPDVKEVFTVVSTGFDHKKYTRKEFETKIYIDKPQNDLVVMKPVAVYGDIPVDIYNTNQLVEDRDFKKEAQIAGLVNQYATAYDGTRYEMVLNNDDLFYKLLTEGIERMQEVAEVFVSEEIMKCKPRYQTKVAVGVSIKGGLLELDLQLDHITIDEMIEVLSKYDKKKKYHRLKNGTFLQIEESGIEEFSELKDRLDISNKELSEGIIPLPTYRSVSVDELLKNGENLNYTRNREFKNLVHSISNALENDYEIPASMEQILREYQKSGFLWMKTLEANGFGGILADDMGLGKTVQVIAFLQSQLEVREGLALIVTPASLVYNWKSELERFAPNIDVTMAVGSVEERCAIIQHIGGSGIVITSYDLLKRDIQEYGEKVFDTLIIDEAQYIKNANTQATKAVKKLSAKFKLALTGTPIENRLSELWSIFDFIMPGFLYSSKKFRVEFENAIVKNGDAERMQILTKMVAPFILRRKKKDVLKDLPDKVEESRVVVLGEEQKKIYEAYQKRLQMTIASKSEADFNTSKIQILAELTKLRQICCDPRLFLDNYQDESAKLEMCMQLVCNAVDGGHKILLFSQFTTMLELIQMRLRKEKISFYTITGSVTKEKRSQLVKDFNHDDTSVFCISLKAGGTGLNLTSADIVIHYDPWWNVAVTDQATDRAHRIGQKQVVTVYKLVAKNTIEEKIMSLQEKKRELADQLLDGEGIANTSFTKEDLMELLSLNKLDTM